MSTIERYTYHSRWRSTCAASWREKRDRHIPAYERLLSEDEFQVARPNPSPNGAVALTLALMSSR